MKEINEKDLEQAAGGGSPTLHHSCDSFELKDGGMWFSPHNCTNCKYFDARRNGRGSCELGKE